MRAAATDSVRAGTNMPWSTHTRAALRTIEATSVCGHTGRPWSASTLAASSALSGTFRHCEWARASSSFSSASNAPIRPGAMRSLIR